MRRKVALAGEGLLMLLRSLPFVLAGWLVSWGVKHHQPPVIVVSAAMGAVLLAVFYVDMFRQSKALRSVDLAPLFDRPRGEERGRSDV